MTEERPASSTDDSRVPVRQSGLASQGETREEALENLDEAVAGYNGAGREPTDEELRELGIDPDENTGSGDIPDVLT